MTDWLSAHAVALRAVSIVLGVFLLAVTVRGLKTGSTALIYRSTSRAQDPVLYWTGVVVWGAAGSFLVVGAIFPALEGL